MGKIWDGQELAKVRWGFYVEETSSAMAQNLEIG